MLNAKICLRRESFRLDIAFRLEQRGFIGVFGHSGCGKTTLLRCIAGLERDADIELEVNGECWQRAGFRRPTSQRRLGYVFQDVRLFPHLSVLKNLTLGQDRNAMSPAEYDKLITLLDIAPLLGRRPADLSGGEQQRVAIARALLRKPAVLLMDEPLSALDSRRKQEILPYLQRLHTEVAIPTLYVTHNHQEVMQLCDHLLLLDEGRILYQGPIRETLHHKRLLELYPELARNHVPATVIGRDTKQRLSHVATALGPLTVAGSYPEDMAITLSIPVNRILLFSSRPAGQANTLEMHVGEIVPLANGRQSIKLEMHQQTLLAELDAAAFAACGLKTGAITWALPTQIEVMG